MKTPEETKKGLEMCGGLDNHVYCKKCPYSEDDCDEMARDALAYIQQLEEREWYLFDLLSSVWHGKSYYFKQEDGTVYSRASCKYMSFDQAVDEFAHELTLEGELRGKYVNVLNWTSTKDGLPKTSGTYLVGCVFEDQFYHITNVAYSAVHKAFNAHDWMDKTEIRSCMPEFWTTVPEVPKEDT